MSLKPLVHARPYGGSPLVRDYLHESSPALDFYYGSPFRLDTYARKAQEVAARFGPDDRRPP
jgi:hypothetical protein